MHAPPHRCGALLMLDLPTDEFGWPYQIRTIMSPGGSGTAGLYEGEDGRVRVLQNTPEGRPVTPSVLLPAPPEIEVAARRWWEEQQAGP